MHYGHPDVFDRVFHITRGGISKASRVINISEDIYSGILFPPFFQENFALILSICVVIVCITQLRSVMFETKRLKNFFNC
jgi:hypothetical protein